MTIIIGIIIVVFMLWQWSGEDPNEYKRTRKKIFKKS